MFYFDELYHNLSNPALNMPNFCANEIAEMFRLVSNYVKESTQFPDAKVAAFEPGKWAGQAFPSVDWVGVECYTTNFNACAGPSGAVSYRTLLDYLEAGLTASQQVIVISWSAVRLNSRPMPPSPPCLGIVSEDRTAYTATDQSTLVGLVDYYASIAAADPKVVAMLPWHGDTYIEGPSCTTGFVGTLDMPQVLAKWKFVTKALGFGYPQ